MNDQSKDDLNDLLKQAFPKEVLARDIEIWLKDMSRKRLTFIALSIGCGGLVILLALLIVPFSETIGKFIFAMASVPFAILAINFQKHVSQSLMPRLCDHLDLQYNDLDPFPETYARHRLITGPKESFDDVYSGKLASHRYVVCEFETERNQRKPGGRFEGFIISIHDSWKGADFCAIRSKSTYGASAELAKDGWKRVSPYDAWTFYQKEPFASAQPSYHACLDLLNRVGANLDGSAWLAAALVEDGKVTLRIADKRNHHNLGGIFTGKKRRRRLLKAALQDFAMPMRLVQAVLSATTDSASSTVSTTQ